MKRGKPSSWKPATGALAQYKSRHSGLSRQGCPVRGIAGAVGDRRVVEIIGHAGRPVRVTVKSIYLHPMPPSLFDGLESTL